MLTKSICDDTFCYEGYGYKMSLQTVENPFTKEKRSIASVESTNAFLVQVKVVSGTKLAVSIPAGMLITADMFPILNKELSNAQKFVEEVEQLLADS